jgi:SAM-dependent methyltransferase
MLADEAGEAGASATVSCRCLSSSTRAMMGDVAFRCSVKPVSTAPIPFPPIELANRVGSLAEMDDPWAHYEGLGRQAKRKILEVLPEDWSFEGKRLYDFGCGAGRTLRHFFEEAQVSEFYGSDIDGRSTRWLRENLSPPFHVFVNDVTPPLPFESGSLDLVYAVSVFTHLANTWSAWLLELHRVLADDGLAIFTFIGPGASRWITEEPWDEDTIGMNVLKPGQSFDFGGPMVLHSEWWIRAHWGRAFEILDLQLRGFGAEPPEGQGVVLLRKRPVSLTTVDIELPEPGEPRELAASQRHVQQLTHELVEFRAAHDHLAAAWTGEQAAREKAERRAAELQASLDRVAASRSWRLTAPLRSAAALLGMGAHMKRRRGA